MPVSQRSLECDFLSLKEDPLQAQGEEWFSGHTHRLSCSWLPCQCACLWMAPVYTQRRWQQREHILKATNEKINTTSRFNYIPMSLTCASQVTAPTSGLRKGSSAIEWIWGMLPTGLLSWGRTICTEAYQSLWDVCHWRTSLILLNPAFPKWISLQISRSLITATSSHPKKWLYLGNTAVSPSHDDKPQQLL